MPTQVKVIHARDFVRATAEGVLDLEESGRLLVELFTAGAHLDNFDVILDTRKAQSELSAADLWSLAVRLANYRRILGGRTVVLCPTERFERATFFASCAENRGLDIRPFTSFEDAMEWLIEDPPAPGKKA
jgi:hypothetical protein